MTSAATGRGDRPRGRPRTADVVPEEKILQVALGQFATVGYDGASLRTINRELGVSHNLLYQRFGTKDELWRAAIDYGFSALPSLETSFDPTVTEPLEQLRLVIRKFLKYSAAHPELLALLNIEGRRDTHRLRYIFENYIEPSQSPIARLLNHLITNGVIRPISLRTLFFLVTHGGASPFSVVPLAELFDPTPPDDPEAVDAHADMVSTVIIEGLRRTD